MLTSGELRHVYRRTVNEWLDDNKAVGDDAHDAGLRAVEAAVRADQIEKDAALAERAPIPFNVVAQYPVRASIAAAIRAQLPPKETNDE